jgi:DNA-binding NarL/FixJ family response regulator
MIRLYFVDDHPLILEGLRSLLCLEEDLQLTGGTRDANTCLSFLMHHSADVVILDNSLPENNSATLCAMIKARFPHVNVLALCYQKEYSGINIMLESGASGCLMKNADKTELLSAVHAIYAGQQYLSAEVAQVLKEKTQQLHITKREKEVLWLIANGYTNHEIAGKLFISTDTVDSHRRKLLGKLNARNTAMLIKCAIDQRLLVSTS